MALENIEVWKAEVSRLEADLKAKDEQIKRMFTCCNGNHCVGTEPCTKEPGQSTETPAPHNCYSCGDVECYNNRDAADLSLKGCNEWKAPSKDDAEFYLPDGPNGMPGTKEGKK